MIGGDREAKMGRCYAMKRMWENLREPSSLPTTVDQKQLENVKYFSSFG
jgi:hypothetical protein